MAALESSRPASLDVVTALNVLAYLTQEEEDRFFRAAARALKPTGSLCVSVGNLLSDLVTLNRYTVEFYERHVLGRLRRDGRGSPRAGRPAPGSRSPTRPCPRRPPKPRTLDASPASATSSRPGGSFSRSSPRGLQRLFGLGVEAVNYYHFWPLPPQVLQQTERLRELQQQFDAKAHDNPLGVVFASQINLRARPPAR